MALSYKHPSWNYGDGPYGRSKKQSILAWASNVKGNGEIWSGDFNVSKIIIIINKKH